MSVFPYDNQNSEWLNKLNDNNVENTIDHFFTQRRVTEYEDVLDDKTLERKKKKSICIYNFLAINFPTIQFKSMANLIIEVEIWGDEKFNFKGTIVKTDGDIPHLMVKLKEDKNIFVKLIFKENEKNLKTFISFIPVVKRYQMTPNSLEDV